MARAVKALTAKQALVTLSRPGPHKVLRGDLGLIGLPGVILTPSSGFGLPAVAFGHGWLQPPRRYLRLLKHLASWGLVVAAPGTHTGALPSHRLLAADLRTALDVCAGVRLGEGNISVHPERLAVAGHCMGAGAAVLAAAEDERVRAVATLALAETRPSALDAAHHCAMPGLHLSAAQDLVAPAVGHAEPVAQVWAGPVQLRSITKATHLAFAEGRHWSDLLLDGRGHHGTQTLTKALLTAFLLRILTGTRAYSALLEEEVRGCVIEYTRGPLPAAARS